MPSYLRLDLFPATVTRADGTLYDPAKVVVTDDTLYVFMDGSPRPQEVFIAKLYDFTTLSRTHWQAVTDEEGEQVEITKRPGCGCGNKLRGFNAFPGVPMMRNR